MPVAPQYKKSSRALFPFRKKLSSRRKFRPSGKAKPVKRTTALVKRVVHSELNKDLELKVQALRPINQDNPEAQATSGTGSNIVWYNQYVLGKGPTSWTGPSGSYNFVNLEGFTWPEGTSSDRRIGRYMNLKHTTMNLRIACDNLSSVSCPIRFRVIVYKQKRNGPALLAQTNPNDNLFLGTVGQELGLNNTYSGDSVSMEFMNMLTNKRKYEIHTDTQFILSPHTFSVQGGSNIVSPISQGYPAEKNMLLRLPHNEKVSFNGTSEMPEDLNYQYCVTVLSMPYGNNTQVSARNWKCNVRGTVSVTDA